jgi:hypothetical protein
MVRIPSPSPIRDPLADVRRLSGRDRLILSWLAEHYVLSTEQLAAALFPSLRAAQRRLTVLHRIGAVSRFAFPRTEQDSGSYRYTLGPLGVRLYPTSYTDPDNPAAKPPRTHVERRARIIRSPRLGHLLGVNQFFIDLLAYARQRTDAQLMRWWSEQHATAIYSARSRQLRPDGHGIWSVGDGEVGFFVEYDSGTENLARVIKKLPAYERLATEGGARYPVLLWVPDRRREANLLRLLAGVPTAMPVATAVHCADPAAPIWALPGDPGPRLHLHELPSGHGPRSTVDPVHFGDTNEVGGDDGVNRL